MSCKKQRFRYLKELGSGAYGKVYKAKDMYRNELVAVKIITANNQTLCPTTIREIGLLKKINHPNIIKYDIYMCVCI